MKYFSSGPFAVQKVHPSKGQKKKGGATHRGAGGQQPNDVAGDSDPDSCTMRGAAAGTGGGDFSKEAFE